MNGIIRTFNAALYQDKNFYIACCDHLETVDQGATPEQAITNFQILTESYLQQAVFPNITLNFDTRSEAANLMVLPLPQVSSCRLIAALERQGFRRTKHCIVLEKKKPFWQYCLCRATSSSASSWYYFQAPILC